MVHIKLVPDIICFQVLLWHRLSALERLHCHISQPVPIQLRTIETDRGKSRCLVLCFVRPDSIQLTCPFLTVNLDAKLMYSIRFGFLPMEFMISNFPDSWYPVFTFVDSVSYRYRALTAP